MTWSILARDSDGRYGVAIASRFFAVGALTVHTRRGVGALATQALVNPLYGPAGLALLGGARTAGDVVATLTAADAGRAQRQLHVIAAHGLGAAHTGDGCVDWCGHRVGDGYSVAGNMLAGPQVLQATIDAFVANAQLPLPERLIEAMTAGEAAGGDKRGKQSAALRIHGDEDHPELDIRVDDHAEPLVELRRLYVKSKERWAIFRRFLPTRLNPGGTIDRAVIDAAIAKEGNPAP